MGKSLIIKGADFSANGFKYGVETKVYNTWYDKDGIATPVTALPLTDKSRGIYYMVDTSSGNNYRIVKSEWGDYLITGFLDVEGYDSLTYKGYVPFTNSIANRGICALAFFDRAESNPNIPIWFAANNDSAGSLTVGGANGKCAYLIGEGGVKELTIDIPQGAKYVVATVRRDSENMITEASITLKRVVKQNG